MVAFSKRRIIGVFFSKSKNIIFSIHSCYFKHLQKINVARYREELLTSFDNKFNNDKLIYEYFQQDEATAHVTGATIYFKQISTLIGLLAKIHQLAS